MARTRTYDPGRKYTGTWPGGEPQSIRDAYDKEFSKEQADRQAARDAAKKKGDK
ncbi:hypothetical protein GCM10010126_68750 [Planomonospora parontospora]|uniref:Uncharacterized protein n=1 Tax=Planomonospora parontospora TaxID=58119 RepID=A0AA37F8P2_9ACTN|nr:hypothetical protein [Planomonospora parontospora]GGK99409.1 hypothetical protein GCM10010126_68750 [Planomonospora parontospora]